MKRTFVVALLGLLASSRAWAQATSATEQEIIKLEQAVTDAQFKKDRAALERLLADDYLYTHSNGSVLNKAQEITESMSSEVRWTDSKLADLKVRIFGDAAVLTGRQTIQGTAKGYVPGPRRITDMFVKRSGRWQWAGGQATLELTKPDAPPLSAQDVAAIKTTLATWKQAGLAGDWPSFFGEFTEAACGWVPRVRRAKGSLRSGKALGSEHSRRSWYPFRSMVAAISPSLAGRCPCCSTRRVVSSTRETFSQCCASSQGVSGAWPFTASGSERGPLWSAGGLRA